ncbi:hypothetical protein A5893_14500 [Pedobacter psychrophilus]|uniref:Secretion system C-terminal sorting domain-containing protein n=1 Tax=Pedobacter psychrophilus TaxID=1826909 RepID=A0A179DDM3_9SPHI|nr:T9SS type A sorting domain-containing protein [Pedobacter psychrophilus]OAQ38619.1 hypothetical protein A5893_14500 [Pedobacter psychrophilus]
MKLTTTIKISFFILFSLLLNICLASSPSDYFRSKQNGNWSDISTWESSVNKITWVNANLTPTSSSIEIEIQSTHTINVLSSIAVNKLIISANAELILNSGVSLSVNNGVALKDVQVFGILNNAGSLNLTGLLYFENGGSYVHNYKTTIGTIPTAVWLDGSNCLISGYTTATSGTLLGATQSFYNFTYNCINQLNTFLYLGFTSSTIVRNNFNVLSTGSGNFVLFPPINASATIKNYTQTGGVVNLTSSNNASFTANLQISGDFNISGGLVRNIDQSRGNIIFNGTNSQIFNKTGGSIGGSLNFAINSSAIVNFGNSILSGNIGTFVLNSNATLLTANTAGITSSGATGSIQSTGIRSFSSAASYVYNGSSTQNTGTGLPSTVKKLIINNLSGVNLRTGSINVTDSLRITGSLNLGTNALTSTNGGFGSGTLSTQNTGASPIGNGKNWLCSVNYNAAGGQIISDGNYSNLLASISGSKIMSNPVTVSDNLIVTGTADITSNGNLTLLATASKNANVAELVGSANVIGNVNVQSYLYGEPSGALRGTKSMSSPINDAAVGGAKTFQQLKNYVIISGPGGTANGFDAGPGPVPTFNPVTLNFYNEPASPTVSAFTAVPTLATSTSPGTGFLLFFRGNRSGIYANPGKMLAPFSPAEDMLVTYAGPINKGDINVNIGFTNYGDAYDGFYLAGNPYPATIDWDAVRSASNNLNSSITIVTGGKANATYNSIGGISANGGSRYIQPGQGFYIQSNSGGGTLRFRENQKNIVNTPARLLSIPSEPNLQLTTLNSTTSLSNKYSAPASSVLSTGKKILRMKLKQDDFEEETVVLFDTRFISLSDENDSKYFPGFDVSLATMSSDNKPMAINLMPDIDQVEDLRVSVSGKQFGNMSLSFSEVGFGDSKELWLQDNYLNTLTPIIQGSVYNFNTIKTIATSFGDKRFKLLFQPPTTLPIKLVSFDAKKNNNGVDLQWTTSEEKNNKGFEIERAGDQNQDFIKIGFVNATVVAQTLNSYTFKDAYPLQGNNYYRLKQLDNDGKFEYSLIKNIKFDFNNQQDLISVYPNPATNFIKVNYGTNQTKELKINIVNVNGAIITSEKYNAGQELKLNVSNLPYGMYLLEIRDEKNILLGMNKFIKK